MKKPTGGNHRSVRVAPRGAGGIFGLPAPGWESYNPDDIGVGHGCWNPTPAPYPLEAPQGDNIGYVFFSIVEPDKVLGMQQTLTADYGFLSGNLLGLGLPLLSASTDRPPFALLQTYYGETR